MPHQIIHASAAPQPVGPYSQGVAAGGLVFISGQIPVDPATGEIKGSTIIEQSHQALRNLKAVLAKAGCTPDALIKTTVYLRSMDDFPSFNVVYEEELRGARPARSIVGASALPKGALVEIEGVACL
ncbi:MAG: regulator [Chitinispirillaceae bacterium]|nr:regulator [Chitinispirillaceae bacterium]